MDLVELGNIGAFAEVADRPAWRFFAGFAFHGEQGPPVLEDDEIDFAPVGVADETKFHSEAPGVFQKVTILEQVSGDQIFEPLTPAGHLRPVPEIELGFLFHRPDARCAEGIYAEADIEIFQYLDPAPHRFMSDLKVLAQTLDRKGGTDPVGQGLDQ